MVASDQMSKTQMIAWLTLEGFVLVQWRNLWIAHDGRHEFNIFVDNLHDMWGGGVRAPEDSEKPASFDVFPAYKLDELIECIEQLRGNADEP